MGYDKELCFLIKLFKRIRFASSRGASTSSRRQKGEGFIRKTEKSSEIKVRAFSPPERRLTFCSLFPGGCATISIPVSRGFASSISLRSTFPPPKSDVKTSE